MQCHHRLINHFQNLQNEHPQILYLAAYFPFLIVTRKALAKGSIVVLYQAVEGRAMINLYVLQQLTLGSYLSQEE